MTLKPAEVPPKIVEARSWKVVPVEAPLGRVTTPVRLKPPAAPKTKKPCGDLFLEGSAR